MTQGFDIISGSIQPEMAKDIAKILNKQLTKTELRKFPNGEIYARLEQTIRRKDVFILQSCSNSDAYSLNDSLMEVLCLVDAAKRASAEKIAVVLPLLPYARQDRKAREREAISAALVLKLLSASGVSRVITIDMHSAQTQAAFDGPLENITVQHLFLDDIRKMINSNKQDFVVIAPDAGSVKKSSKIAEELGLQIVFMPKTRAEEDSSNISRPNSVLGVKNKKCIIIDDMIDTGGTIITAAHTLKQSGANDITIYATHGIFSNNAAKRILESDIDTVIVTNTLPQKDNIAILGNKLKVISVTNLLAKTIKHVHLGESLLNID